MNTIIAILFSLQQYDTLPAILKVREGKSFHKYVMGKVVLTKDCKVIEYLQVNTWKRKERLFPFKGNVVDYRLIQK